LLEQSQITAGILRWYEKFQRDLPWRKTTEPYPIWLSEVILQQTRVNQGLPYYLKFIELFPTVEDLADASEQEVLKAWEGLGYYSRARNLHACAKIISSDYDGKFPKTFEKLLQLPGIGPYTAAAIASFCFDEKVAVVDGNVFRVLARVFGIDLDIRKSQKYFRKIADEMIPSDRPGMFNQAMMEFGALQCIPRNPDCPQCPVQSHCTAFKMGLQHELPFKSRAKPSRNRYFHYLVLQHEDRLLMRERSSNDIWKNLYDFPLIENKSFLPEEDLLKLSNDLLDSTLMLEEVSPVYRHLLSHQNLYVRFYLLRPDLKGGNAAIKHKDSHLININDVADLPKPVLITRYLNDHIF